MSFSECEVRVESEGFSAGDPSFVVFEGKQLSLTAPLTMKCSHQVRPRHLIGVKIDFNCFHA